MGDPWPADLPGVLALPSGRRVLGRSVRAAPPAPEPEFGLYLVRRRPPGTAWEQVWVPWRDFGLPAEPDALRRALATAWAHAADRRVEIACGGGTGRTGTALACLAVLDGVPADEAVAFVRQHYRRRAVETRWQRRFVLHFPDELPGPTASA